MKTSKFEVTLDVSNLTGSAWDSWCESDPVDGITYNALQRDGLEHWTVEAETAELARERVASTLADANVDIINVTES